MPTTVKHENFDGVTAPAIPAGFTRENAAIVTSTTHARSAANALKNTSTTTYYFMCDTKDGNKGTCIVRAAVFFTATSGVFRLIGRAATENRLDCYEVIVNPNGTNAVTLTSRAAGTPTTIGTPMGDGTTFALNAWYVVSLEIIGTSLRVQIQRDSDSKYLKADNTWVTAVDTRCIAFNHGGSALAQVSDYAGVAIGTNGGSDSEVYVDDFDLLKPKINLVQLNTSESANSSTARTLSFGSNLTSGNFVVVSVACFTGSPLDLTVTDNLGNQYHSLTNYNITPGASKIFVFWAQSVTAGPCTVTVDPNGTSVYMGLAIHEYSGPGPLSVVEAWSSKHEAAATAASAGTPPLMHDDDAVFACYTQAAGTVAATEGGMFTKRSNRTNSSTTFTMISQDDVYPLAAEDTPLTWASSVTYEGLAFSFRPDYTSASTVNPIPLQTTEVQYVSPTTSTWVTTPQSMVFPRPTTNGNLLICAVGTITGSAGLLTTTVTDNKGNTWTLLNHEEDAVNGLRVEIWKCPNAVGGANHIITVTPDDNVYIAAVANEYNGSQGVTAITKNASGDDPNPDTGSFNSVAHGLTIAVMGHNATPGATAAYQNSIGFNRDWTNLWSLPAQSQTTMGLSVISFGDVIDDPGQALDAMWTFADTRFWVVTAVVLVSSSAPTPDSSCICSEDSMLLEVNQPFVREFPLGVTGLTVNIQLSKNGAALGDPAAGPSTLTEVGRGLYKFALDADDVDTLGSLGYALTDDDTNAIIYGRAVDRVWEIAHDIFTNPNPDNFMVASTFGATFTQNGVIALNTDLTPLPDMAEPTEPPPSDAPLIDGLSWIFHLDVVRRDETEAIQRIYNRAGDDVIATSDQSDDGTTYVHAGYSA